MRAQQRLHGRAMVAQHTLRNSVSLDGAGVHTGVSVRLTLHPADAGTGLVFHRTDLPGGRERFIPARVSDVVSSDLATRVAPRGAPDDGVGTTEHVLAALHALGVDNAILEVDGPEVPILDGTAEPFVVAIDDVGVVAQRAARKALEILRPLRVAVGRACAEWRPHADGLRLAAAIDYAHPAIGRQSRTVQLEQSTFRREIARARTFGFTADAERLWRAGYARGSSFENTIVVGPTGVLNPGGLRHRDEFVRHKLLDIVGDLALLGMPIRGEFRSVRGGHALNRIALAALLADTTAWRVVEADSRPAVSPGQMAPMKAAAAS